MSTIQTSFVFVCVLGQAVNTADIEPAANVQVEVFHGARECYGILWFPSIENPFVYTAAISPLLAWQA